MIERKCRNNEVTSFLFVQQEDGEKKEKYTRRSFCPEDGVYI